MLCTVLEFILPSVDYDDVVRCGVGSKWCLEYCESSCIWEIQCERMWCDKVYIPKEIRDIREGDPRKAFRAALCDSKRTWITLDELMGFRWWHRMKADAGEDSLELDAWWNGNLELQRSLEFKSDHTTFWTTPTQRTGGTWRFVTRCCGMIDGVWGGACYDKWEASSDRVMHEATFGRFLRGRPRHTVHETPTKVVFRHAATWGFILDSCWSLQTSWPMPPRGSDPSLEDDALIMNARNMELEASRFKCCEHIDPQDPDPLES